MNDTNRGSLRTYLLYILALVAAILMAGATGFYYFEHHHNENVHSLWDGVWWAITTVTTVGYGDVSPQTTGGRFVAVFLMFVGIGTVGISTGAIAAYFVKSDQLQSLRMRGIRQHVVICGLGDKGLLLTKAFRAQGQPVVVIESQETNDNRGLADALGAIVLLGDATHPEMLTRARVQDARTLIAVCGDDGANAEVAAHARELVAGRRDSPLTCSVHIVDAELWYLLRRWEIEADNAFRLEFFNVFDIGARALLSAHPPFPETKPGAPPPAITPHLLVVGANKLGQNVTIHAARLWREQHGASGTRLRVTLVDRDTSELKESLHTRHPGLDRVCELNALSLDVKSSAFHQGSFLFDAQKHPLVTAVYVCVDDDSLALSAALALLHRVRHHRIPIVVRMAQDAGLATLLHGNRRNEHGADMLYAFGLLDQTCQPDLVLGGTNEVLARAIHESYLRDQRQAVQQEAENSARENPAAVAWERLSEELKESNRRQADNIGLHLQSIGCDIAPLSDWDAAAFTFTPEELEQMARREHERWATERQALGWRYGPRDPVHKTNPNLLPWEQLPENIREANRGEIRGLAVSLARAGFQIYRLKSA